MNECHALNWSFGVNFGGYQSQRWPKWWFISKSNLCSFKKSKQNNTAALNFKRLMTCWNFLENFRQTLHLAELRYASMEGAGDFLGFLSTIVPPICPLTLLLAISLGVVGREVDQFAPWKEYPAAEAAAGERPNAIPARCKRKEKSKNQMQLYHIHETHQPSQA